MGIPRTPHSPVPSIRSAMRTATSSSAATGARGVQPAWAPSSWSRTGEPSRPVTSSPVSLAKPPRPVNIVGGLPRVAELFEVRKPKDMAVVSEIAGTVSFAGEAKGKRKLDRHAEVGRIQGIPGAQGQAHHRVRRATSSSAATADRRLPRAARHPAHQAAKSTWPLPGGRDPGSVPLPGRGHRRQAHRSHRAPDAQQGHRLIPAGNELPRGRTGGQGRVQGREPQGHRRRTFRRHRRTAGAGHHPGSADHLVLHLGGLPSRKPPRCSPRLPSRARWTTLRGLKENVIVGRRHPGRYGLSRVCPRRTSPCLDRRTSRTVPGDLRENPCWWIWASRPSPPLNIRATVIWRSPFFMLARPVPAWSAMSRHRTRPFRTAPRPPYLLRRLPAPAPPNATKWRVPSSLLFVLILKRQTRLPAKPGGPWARRIPSPPSRRVVKRSSKNYSYGAQHGSVQFNILK